MTNEERTQVADGLLALVFSLRGDDGPQGQSWLLSVASTMLARAILGSVGPTGDATDLLALSAQTVTTEVQAAQSRQIRAQLSRGLGANRGA